CAACCPATPARRCACMHCFRANGSCRPRSACSWTRSAGRRASRFDGSGRYFCNFQAPLTMLLANQGQSTHPIQGKPSWRRRLVSLTPKSRALVTRMAPQIEAAYERIESEISADCIERCYAVFDEMLLAIPVDDDGE